nr:MAG TPA: tail spike protein [Caudoviricetes sp.]
MADFETLKTVKYWTQRCIPLVYDNSLSIYQLLGKIINELNKLIENNNILPDYIADMIRDYISSGAIEQVVREILANYILNVKYPPAGITPAVGDGSQDDTAAVQGCIDYASAQGGGAVYLPYGKYSVQSLTLKSNVTLFGFDRYTTKLVLRGGATNPLILLNGSDAGIYNLTLDGNAGIQVNDINIISMIAQNVLLNNLIIEDGYQLLVYNGTGGHLQINDVVFGNAVYRAVGISGNSVVQAKGLKFNQLSAVSGSDVLNVSSDGGSYDFISDVSCETCLSVSGNDNYFTGIVSGATNIFVDSGSRNTIDFKGNTKKVYYSGESDTTIEGDTSFTTNGAYSENVSGAFTSARNSTESKVVTGASVEQYNSSQTETVTGKKTINAKDIELNPINPLQYKTPTTLNDFFSTIPFKDSNDTYNVLVSTDKTKNLIGYVDVRNFGALGDGVSDDTEAFINAIEYCVANNKTLYIPNTGTFDGEGYILSKTLNVHRPITIIMDKTAVLNFKNTHLNPDNVYTTKDGYRDYTYGVGINIDYGNYSNHRGYYSFGTIRGDWSNYLNGASQPTGTWWTGIRIASSDIVTLNCEYIDYWNTGLLIEGNTSESTLLTLNNNINIKIIDDCQTGIFFGNGCGLIDCNINTIGFAKYCVVFDENCSRINFNAVQLNSEYPDGAVFYITYSNTAPSQLSVNVRQCVGALAGGNPSKLNNTTPIYNPIISGNTQYKNKNIGFASYSRFNIGFFRSDWPVSNTIINIGGYATIVNNITNLYGNLISTPYICEESPTNTNYITSNYIYCKYTTKTQIDIESNLTLYVPCDLLTEKQDNFISIVPTNTFQGALYTANNDTYNNYGYIVIGVHAIETIPQSTDLLFKLKIN